MWFMVIVLIFPAVPDPGAPTMNYTVVVLGGVLFLAIVYYYIPHYGGRYWFTGPVANVEAELDRTDSAVGEKVEGHLT